MRYSWDPRKNRQNVTRHGIAFEDAVRIFDGPTLERVDDRFAYDEVRGYAIGLVNRIEMAVIYTAFRTLSTELFRRGEQNGMKEKLIGRASAKARTDWKRVRSLSDRQIRRAIESDPDVCPTDAEFWKNARVVMPAAKKTVTIRLDADLLEWLRRERGYQTRINAVLRAYMNASRVSGGGAPRTASSKPIRSSATSTPPAPSKVRPT